MIFWLSLTALSPLPWQKNINICILYLFLCVWRKGVVKNKNKCKFHFVISSQVFLADCTSNPINHWLLEPPWRINSTVLLRDSLAWLEPRGASFSTFSTKKLTTAARSPYRHANLYHDRVSTMSFYAFRQLNDKIWFHGFGRSCPVKATIIPFLVHCSSLMLLHKLHSVRFDL